MKKTLVVMLMMFTVLYGVSAQSAAGTGVIKELTGQVELKAAGRTAFTAARSGDKVAQDTIVSTGFKSTAVIEVGSTMITVRPLTRLSLAEIQSSEKEENLNVNLQTGRVRVDVKPPAGTKANITVQSPAATASVRGTSFEFDTVNLTVLEGTVFFSGAVGAPATVAAGEMNSIGRNGTPTGSTSTVSLLPSPPVDMPSDRTQTPSSSLPDGNVIITIID